MIPLALILAALIVPPAWAADPAGDWSEATVRRIDPANGRITLRHGPIPNLDMPPMTMVFRAPPDAIENLKPGDRVRFRAERIEGAYRVMAIEPEQTGN